MSALRLVTFDATRTLLQFRIPVFEQYAVAGRKFGIECDQSVIRTNFNEAWGTLSKEHPVFGRDTGLGWHKWWTTMVHRSFADYIKTSEDKAKLDRTVEFLMNHFSSGQAYNSSTGSLELLEYLQEQKVTLGVISNFDPRLHLILKDLKLSQYFSFILTSYEFGFEKPDRRIFEEALKRGCPEGVQNTFHVGDDDLLDYHGSTNAGFQGLLVKPGGRCKDSKIDASFVFSDLEGVLNFFKVKYKKERINTDSL